MYSKEGMPIRRNHITEENVRLKLKIFTEHKPLVHVNCPTCSCLLHKSSACNDMHHCGKVHVCNFCQQKSFPWEKNGLPLSHWKNCPRWDHDLPWFKCKEGECLTNGKDCINHSESIKELENQRWNTAYKSIINKN